MILAASLLLVGSHPSVAWGCRDPQVPENDPEQSGLQPRISPYFACAAEAM
jgi:hypothetical protein